MRDQCDLGICPLRMLAHESRQQASEQPGQLLPDCKCVAGMCEWWQAAYARCAVSELAFELKEIMALLT